MLELFQRFLVLELLLALSFIMPEILFEFSPGRLQCVSHFSLKPGFVLAQITC